MTAFVALATLLAVMLLRRSCNMSTLLSSGFLPSESKSI